MLENLDLSSNALTGEIWPVLQDLPNLYTLFLDGNGFSGRLPLFDSLSNLSALSLGSNYLHGPIPELLYNCSFLSYLDISHNSLSGPISSEIGKLNRLQVFLATANNFTGILPSELKNLSKLRYLSFSNNILSGSIDPFCFSTLSSLLALDISHNHFVGQFPMFPGVSNIVVLKASYNKFEGEIPSAVWQLSRLQILDLSNNQFKGSIPKNLTGLDGLTKTSKVSIDQYFYLVFPTELVNKGTVSTFTYIRKDFRLVSLSGNRLSGSIPTNIGDLKGLRDLNLSRNDFTGRIPSTLKSLTSLESLDLSQNSLEGAIPFEICEIDGLGTFKLFMNNLSGSIPELSSKCETKLGYSDLLPGNELLCGPPVKRNCRTTSVPILYSDSSRSTGWMSWPAIYSGFLIGYLVMGLMLLLSRTMRHGLFKFVPVPTHRISLD